ncbi:MAG: hypothetical protein R3223_09910 [Longimicrobiales bacterium]|nr:hypothetical protein [Longimicrobiales bacterium]
MATEKARVARLRTDVETRAEDRPGVYRMVDASGEPLYVGKSVRVRSRLLSYFRAPPGDKAADLIRSAASIVWEYVPNEFWAVVRELRLIKEWLPRYNVEHARKTRYAFVKVTREPAPRLLLVGRAADDGCIHFGPFPRPARLAETIRDLSHTVGIRDCPASTPIRFGDQLEMFGSGPPPRCLRTDTGSCLAPCAGRCTEAEYAERVEIVRRFLEGRSREPLLRLEERMRAAAARHDYEYAALLRDRRERLAALQETLVAFRGRVESMNLVYRVPGFRGDDRLYLIRRGLVADELPHPKGRKERRDAARRIEATFFAGAGESPTEIGGAAAAEMLLVARWFRRHPREEDRARSPDDWLAEKRPA